MMVHDHPALSLSWQCRLLSIGRSSLYYKPKGKSTQSARADGEGEGELVLESSCHCSTRLSSAMIRQRSRLPRIGSSLISRPAMTVMPAPGSPTSWNLTGWRSNMAA